METNLKRRRGDVSISEPSSFKRSISPPPRKTAKVTTGIRSPFQLTRIRDLPDTANQDVVSLGDLLKDPLIAECWEFNFLHDIPFFMSHFDSDTRGLVRVHVVHGFWKREDSNRLALEEEASSYSNVELHAAFMPELFGTHHSKMMILIRHDATAQVIIHTANMIPKDWTNMTNAVWRSPLLPTLPKLDPGRRKSLDALEDSCETDSEVGTGDKFKLDLLRYLNAYNSRRKTTDSLVKTLAEYDFSSIRACLVASVPGRHALHDVSRPAWGWLGLKRALRHIPAQQGRSDVVVQVSSIATLGATDSWLQKYLFDSLATSKTTSPSTRPNFKVVYPTADEIRRSLDGYASGASIHTKTQSPQQVKQLAYMRPVFYHWANDTTDGKDLPSNVERQNSGRQRAAPHIKTYIRYGEHSIDWALLTSANISKQAWGEAPSASQEVRIASWEIGVLVWPSLVAGSEHAIMKGTFGIDEPSEHLSEAGKDSVVALRMPYSLPLQPYGDQEVPWVPTMAHDEPDWMGSTWGT